MIDTHSHIYSDEFDDDRDEVIARAQKAGVEKIILPNIDSESLSRMLALEDQYPDYCYSAIGLHPTSVKENFEEELHLVHSELKRRKFIAIGEIGIDLYWDKTFLKKQIYSFQKQVEWALEYQLPIIIHQRNSFTEIIEALSPFKYQELKGVFHSFGGTVDEAQEIFKVGDFLLGINGVVTFKNSNIKETLKSIPLEKIILETDSPYLTPVPFRGKRNESAYVSFVADKLSEIYNTSFTHISEVTTSNAVKLFF